MLIPSTDHGLVAALLIRKGHGPPSFAGRWTWSVGLTCRLPLDQPIRARC